MALLRSLKIQSRKDLERRAKGRYWRDTMDMVSDKEFATVLDEWRERAFPDVCKLSIGECSGLFVSD